MVAGRFSGRSVAVSLRPVRRSEVAAAEPPAGPGSARPDRTGPAGSAPPVEVAGLVKRYGGTVAVAGVDLLVWGGVHGLLGPNGAGKTTLLRILFGLVRPDAGTARLFGRPPGAGPAALAGVAGFVESPRFYPYLSARRNLELLAGYDDLRDRGRVGDALAETGLVARAGDRVGGFSLGLRQRLGVAAALLRRPRLLLLDEPANGLDPAGARDMRALVRDLAADGRTVLLSSHDMGEVELLCQDVTILRSGRVVHSGTLDQLRAQAPDPAHRMRTSDDPAALALAARSPGVVGRRHPDGGLAVQAAGAELDGYVLALAHAGVAVRSLTLEAAPLESLFFALTEPAAEPPAEPSAGPGAGRSADP
jgi:ABC-2 type transport system ATP-binding protein